MVLIDDQEQDECDSLPFFSVPFLFKASSWQAALSDSNEEASSDSEEEEEQGKRQARNIHAGFRAGP